MEIYQVSASSFYMSFIGESDIALLEVDIPFFLDSYSDIMFIDSTEYLSSFSFEGIFEFLSIQKGLDFIGFFEFLSILVFCFFCFLLDLPQSVCGDFSCESLGDEHIACLGARYGDDFSIATEVSNIAKKLYSECRCSHRVTIEKSEKNAKIPDKTKY
jgi:hypothetical protein